MSTARERIAALTGLSKQEDVYVGLSAVLAILDEDAADEGDRRTILPLGAVDTQVEALAERMAGVSTQEAADRLSKDVRAAAAALPAGELPPFVSRWLARSADRKTELVLFLVQARAAEMLSAKEGPSR
jgi:hypothetical protein